MLLNLWLELWKRLGLDRLFAAATDGDEADVAWSRVAGRAGHQPAVGAGQRADDRAALVSGDRAGRSAGNGGRPAQRHPAVPPPGRMLPHKTKLERHLKQRYGELFGPSSTCCCTTLPGFIGKGQQRRMR